MKTHGLVDNALACEGGISMKEDTHGGAVGGFVALKVLDGAGLS
jgi:hypothetical protein